MNNVLALVAGSVAGGLSRYYLSNFVSCHLGHRFPFGTLAVNLAGSFLIGLFAAMATARVGLSAEAKLLLMTGFCGAFTTFSALVYETNDLLVRGEAARAFLYVCGSLVLGFVLFQAGARLGASL